MAITTDSYVTINGHSVGLSKVISQVTLADVEDVIYSGYLDDKRNCNMLPAGQNIPLPRLASTSDSDSTVKVYHIGEFNLVTESSTLEGQLYFRNVLLYMDSGYGFGGSAILFPDTYNAGHMHFITEIDIQELELVCNPDVNVQHTAGVKYYGSDVTYGAICVAQVIKDSNDKFIIATLGGYNCDNYTRFNSPILYNPSYDMYYFRRYNYPGAGYLNIDKSSRWCFEPNLRYSLGPCTFNGTSYQAPESLAKVTLNYWGGTNFFDITMNDPDSTNYIYYAWGGLRFTDGTKHYKPIVEDGYITGYTDDDSVTSEFDDWENISDHTTPATPPSPTPPTPSGDNDDIDSMGFDGMSCSVGGPARYYIMSYNDIHHLIGDFNAHAEPGTSISNNIISCYVNALDWNWSTGSEPIEIYSGGAQTVAFTSDVNYAVLTGYNARDIIGSIDVPRMTNTFYDFSPYSTYEVYVPFCGWVALPDTVAGRHIKIYFETDEATCGCKGRVFFVDDNGNGVTVAEITGSFGAPCPIQVIEGGLYKQAMLSNGLQVIGGIASGVMGGASGSGVLAVGGLSNAMQSLGNCLIAGNTNYGQTIGRAGDASGLMCAGKPYLKITYPPIDAVVNNSIFGHTVGYLCNEIGKLSNYHGFTVCGNPHINISATSAEKEEIKHLLEQGVILP